MDDLDVRDAGRRLGQLAIAILVGTVCAIVIAFALPQTSMRGWGGGALANPFLIAAGACGLSLGLYAVLDVWLRGIRPRRPLPIAQLVSGRGRKLRPGKR